MVMAFSHFSSRHVQSLINCFTRSCRPVAFLRLLSCRCPPGTTAGLADSELFRGISLQVAMNPVTAMEQRPPRVPKLAWVKEEEESPGAGPAQGTEEVVPFQAVQEGEWQSWASGLVLHPAWAHPIPSHPIPCHAIPSHPSLNLIVQVAVEVRGWIW